MLLLLLAGLLSLGWADFTLTGEIQIFSSSSPGFGVSPPVDTTVVYSSTLDIFERPTLQTGSITGFPLFWRSNASSTGSYPYTMNFMGNPGTFTRNPFQPDSTSTVAPPHTGGTWNFFTLRVRGVASASGSASVTSQGDFAMYGNSNLICYQAGVTTARTATSCSITSGQIIDIFFASRATPLSFSITNMPLMSNALANGACSVSTQQQRVNNIYPFSSSNLSVAGAVTVTNQNLLTFATGPSSSQFAWATQLVRPAGGFQTTFLWTLSSSATPEGFAFVIQGAGANVVGDSGHNLGYNIKQSLAIEFDTSVDSGYDTAAGPHVDVHSNWAAVNSAQPGTDDLSTAGVFAFTSGATYEVMIQYSLTAPGVGQLSAYLSAANKGLAGGTNTVVNVANIAHSNFMAMFPSKLGWVGFTTSASSGNPSTLTITDWKVYQVPVAPLKTTTTPAAFSTDIARNSPSGPVITFTLIDACGAQIPNGGDSVVATLYDQTNSKSFTGTGSPPNCYSCGGTSVVMNSPPTGDGTYSVWYYYTLAQPLTPIQFYVQVNGEPVNLISSVETYFPVTITAAPIAAYNCSVLAVDELNPSTPINLLTYQFLASTIMDVTVYAKDQFGNNNTVASPNGFTVAWSNQPSYTSPTITGNQYFFKNVTNHLAGTQQTLFIKYQGSDVQGGVPFGPITVLPDIRPGVAASETTLTGLGLVYAVAGQPATATFSLQDFWTNTITNLNAGGYAGGLTASATFTCAPAPCTPPAFVNPVTPNTASGTLQSPPLFTVTFGSTLAGLYNLSISITHAYDGDGGAKLPTASGTTQTFTLFQPSISPGVEAASKSVLLPKAPYYVSLQGFVSIQAADQYGNNRTVANTNQPFDVQLGTGSTAVTVPCDGTLASGPATPSEVKDVTCKYTAAGVYQISFTPQKTENLAIAVNQPLSGSTGNTTWTPLGTVFVQPGQPCPLCDVIALAPAWSNYTLKSVIAGVPSWFTVTDFDKLGNQRPFSGDSLLYLAKLTNPSTPISNATVIPGTSTQSFMGNWTYHVEIAGWYNLSVTLLGTGLANNGQPVQIVPNYTRVDNCILAGPGLNGGPAQSGQWFTLQAVDWYGNINNYTANGDPTNNNFDTITCGVVVGGVEDLTQCNAVFLPGTQGVWNLSYTVPVFAAPYTYILRIHLIPTKLPLEQQRDLTMYIGQNGAANYAMVYPYNSTPTNQPPPCPFGGYLGTYPAATYSVLYLRHHGIVAPCGDTSKLSPPPTWNIKFIYPFLSTSPIAQFTGVSNFSVNIGASAGAFCKAVAPGTGCFSESIQFYPKLAANNYSVTVLAGSTETDQSQGGTSGMNERLWVTIVPGQVYSPQSYVTGVLDGLNTVAGIMNSFNLTFADMEGNLLVVSGNQATDVKAAGINPVVSGSGQLPGQTQDLTTTSFTSSATTDPATLAYTINATKAGTITLIFNIPSSANGANPLQSKGFQITVTPGALYSACFVQSLTNTTCMGSWEVYSTDAVAGVSGNVYVLAFDLWNNLLVDPTITFGLTLASNSPNISGSITTQKVTGTPGLYQIGFLAFKSVQLGALSAQYNGQTVANAHLNVDPADIDPAHSWVTGLNTTGVAGQVFQFVFYAFDRFDNPWYFVQDLSNHVVASLAGPLPAKQGLAGTQNAIVHSSAAGVFTYSWIPSIATSHTPLLYVLSLSCTGAASGSTPVIYTASSSTPIMTGNNNPQGTLIPFPVIAGPPYAVKSKYPYFSNLQIRAGDLSSYTISLEDQYGNIIWTGGNHLIVQFYYGATPTCKDDATPDPTTVANVTGEFQGWPYYQDLGDGNYTVNIQAFKANYYYSWVQVQEGQKSQNPSLGTEVCITCATVCVTCITPCPKVPTPFQIVPLEPNATHSFLLDGVIANPQSTIAGQPLTFDIALFDKYDNPVMKGGWDVTQAKGTSPPYPNDYSQGICAGEPWLDLLGAIPPGQIIDNGNGNYTVKWTATLATTVGAVLVVINQTTAMGSAIQWPTCHNITILPWYVAYETIYYQWNITSTAPGTAQTEGLEDYVQIYGFDKFNNPQNQGAFYWTDDILRDKTYSPPTDVLAPYEFLITTVRPYPLSFHQDAPFILHHPGNYSLSVSFIQDPIYADPTKFPLTLPNPVPTSIYVTIQPRSCQGRLDIGMAVAGPYTCPDETCANSIGACGAGGAGGASNGRSCPAGYTFCSDGYTCVGKSAQCPTTPTAPAAAFYGSQVMCSTGTLCSDGSCQASCGNVVVYSCLKALPVKCPDGSCRASTDDCPTGISCQAGYVLCNNGHCMLGSSGAACAGYELGACPLNTTRCQDGTCKTNPLLCPTGITCPLARPYLCADRSCVASVGLCRSPTNCVFNTTTPYPCFDGSCAVNASQCPTPPTCGITAPVLCEDFSCAPTLNACGAAPRGPNPASNVCPDHLPFNCLLDGSCAAQLAACPTGVVCGPDSPVKCSTAACSVASNTCPSFVCSNGTVPCPGGGCATHYSECPTSITCPVDHVRCSDGSCRISCYGVTRDPSTFCQFPLMNCPSHEAGFQCALQGSDCPLSVVCPPTRPVRCLDRSCVASVEFCKPVPSYLATKKTCASNTWNDLSSDCANQRGTTCPPNFPAKCWDETCRVLSSDCPPEPPCVQDSANPADTAPYLCSNGDCHQNLYDCISSGISCSIPTPVKCPVAGAAFPQITCAATLADCYNPANLSVIFQCPNNGNLCPNGACQGTCTPIQCPHYIPILCADGHCAWSQAMCSDPKYSCPPGTTRCQDGSCKPSGSCGGAPSCPAGTQACNDGSCQPSCVNANANGNAGCGTLANGADRPRCWDGTCSIGSNGCNIPRVEVGTFSIPNACPMQTPYKCPNGYCAVSSSACVVLPQVVGSCSAGSPVMCADGSCQMTGEQCPTIQPCGPSISGSGQQVRCPNGRCADSLSVCPLWKRCGSGTVMCPNGLCASSLASCADFWTGCPNGTSKCSDGLCSASCQSYSTGNGCASGAKCWDGSCSSACPASPGSCNPADPAAGPCSPPSPAAGMTAWNTALATPVRCFDGSQKAYVTDGSQVATACQQGGGGSGTYASGMAAVVCPSTRPNVCHDGSCVALPSHCPAFMPCPAGTSLCLDMTCAASCPPLYCPAGSPVVCPDGSCRRVARECGALRGANCTSTQVRCFDGTCASKPWNCITRNPLAGSSFAPTASVDTVCPAGTRLCWNGQCVRIESSIFVGLQASDPNFQTVSGCPFVPSCPLTLPMLCPDGSCINTTITPNCPAVAPCATGVRCEDGTCRATCLPYAGCNQTFPYLCPFSKYRCVDSKKTCDTIQTPGVCPGNCKKYTEVLAQVVSVPGTRSITVDAAYSSTFSPVLWFNFPGGLFQKSTLAKIWPVPFQALRGGVAKIGGIFVPKTPEQILLSPPWQINVGGQTPGGTFPLNFTVRAVIDRLFYASSDTGAVIVTAPCSFRGTWNAKTDNLACSSTLIITDTALSWTSAINATNAPANSTCPYYKYSGVVTNFTQGNALSDGSVSDCMCISVSSSDPASNANWRYKVNTTVCLNLYTNAQGSQYVNVNPSVATVGVGCLQAGPYLDGGAALILTTPDPNAATCQGNIAGNIASQDICLGQFDPTVTPPVWSCVRPTYTERVAAPVWVETWGDPASLVTGQFVGFKTGVTYGMLNIPLPPPDIVIPEGESWWQKYGKIVLGVTISMFILLLILAYAISRLIRYREKYLVEKRDAAALREEAQELDEKHGGLGVYDEEVEMIANPLVVQMQELQKQLEQTNASLSTQEELDATQMAAMDKERQRILEEIKRVKDAIAAQKKSAPTAAYDAPATNPTQAPASGTTAAPAATSERQEFVQSAPPRKKKQEF